MLGYTAAQPTKLLGFGSQPMVNCLHFLPVQVNFMPSQSSKRWCWLDIGLIILVLGSLYWLFLGSRPLFVPDEGRYAEIAREMVASGNYLTPYLNHIKYFEKPILFYWLTAFAIKIGGLNLWAIRSVNALLALSGVISTYCFMGFLFNRRTALITSFILGTSLLYATMARMITLDLPVTVFLSISLFAYLAQVRSKTPRTKHYLLCFAASMAALAVLTKGLIGIVFPIMIILIWILLTRQFRLLKPLFSPIPILLFLIIATPWHLLVGLYNPEFYYYYFIEQHFLRYATKDVGHYQPLWYFIPVFILGFFPWIAFVPRTLLTLWRTPLTKSITGQNVLFFLIWALSIFIFFSFSNSKLIPYILPIFPPAAVLIGWYLSLNLPVKAYRYDFILWLLLSLGIGVGLIIFSQTITFPHPQGKNILSAVGILLIIGSIVGNYCSLKQLNYGLIAIVAMMWFVITSLFFNFSMLDSRSIAPLAAIINLQAAATDDVITYNQYFQDLPFYLKRRVSILNWQNEFAFGMQHQNTETWMINDMEFERRLASSQRVFVLISKSEYQRLIQRYPIEKTCILGATTNTLVFSNQARGLTCIPFTP